MQPQTNRSVATLMHYADTGESGETFDIDVQTVPWSKLGSRFLASLRRLDDSESGEAYEAEVEALDQRQPEEEPDSKSAPSPPSKVSS